MVLQLPPPSYKMTREGQCYEVHYGTITVPAMHWIGYVSSPSGILHCARVDYLCFILNHQLSGSTYLYGRYLQLVVRHGLAGNYWACAIALHADQGHLVAVVPTEYGNERSSFSII